MRKRETDQGIRNIIGANVEFRRRELQMKQRDLLEQLNEAGVNINASGLSKIEGQTRFVSDFELKVLSDILGVSVDWLLT